MRKSPPATLAHSRRPLQLPLVETVRNHFNFVCCSVDYCSHYGLNSGLPGAGKFARPGADFDVRLNLSWLYDFLISRVVPGSRSHISGQSISSSVYRFEDTDSKPEMVEHPVFNYVENICVIYFTIEYLLRFWVAPRKLSFVKEFLNIIGRFL
jgi:hypothetical protein